MPHIPQAVLDRSPFLEGLTLLSRGKVRDTYALPGYDEFMLVVVSDRISIFDYVLNEEIYLKGSILNAFNIFWRLTFGDKFAHDLIAYGVGIDKYLPIHLRNGPELQKRAIVVRRIKIIPVEGIVRGYLLGTGWEAYKTTNPHNVCGLVLPDGLAEGSKLPSPIFTPTTKAVVGHDEHMLASEVEEKYPGFGKRCMDLYSVASDYALKRGIIIPDTKFEGNPFELGDEWLTPDSSRCWLLRAYTQAMMEGKLPPSLDKQYVRNEGRRLFIEKDDKGRKRSPENPQDLAFVDACRLSDAVKRMTTASYRYPFWAITGYKIEDYWSKVMGISVEKHVPRVEILVGSASDLDQTLEGQNLLEKAGANFRVRVISCHRNLFELVTPDYGLELAKADWVLAGAGWAAQLPGIVKALTCEVGHPETPVVGIGFKSGSEKKDLAAKLSISELPGQPVVMDKDGEPFFGESGFTMACVAALVREPLPGEVAKKPSELIKAFSE